ncbi:MAG: NPCBM/NEW2 domain-containing protein, partial [Phycisphaerales bacterium]|nr:NPCBM/NEW2 domain-containing protein [Phycisphaerales bacterium]
RAGTAAFVLTVVCATRAGAVLAADPGVEVRVRTVEPDPVVGRLTALSLQSGAVLQSGDDKRQIATRDVISMEVFDAYRESTPDDSDDPPVGRDGAFVGLANGDRIKGRIGRSAADVLALDTPDLGNLTLPLEQVARIRFAQAAMPAYAESVRWFERPLASEDDRLLLTNGDVVRGFVTAIDHEGVTIDNGSAKNTIPLRLVVAARLIHPQPAPPQGLYAVAAFRDGSRITFTSLEWVNREIEARSAGGARLEFDAGRVSRLDLLGGRWEWLSSQSPASYEHTPMLALDWEYRPDRNVMGGPLTVAGETFKRGIGVHSRSSLIFEIRGEYRELVTSFGMDDDSGPAADVTVAILVDGQKRFEKAHIRSGMLHGPVRLDVAKAGRLELIVDFGENGDLQDRFDWIETGLIRP